MSCATLGCGATPCGPCAAKRAAQAAHMGAIDPLDPLGAIATLDPQVSQVAPAIDTIAHMIGVPDIATSAFDTVVGIGTPVSAADAEAFAHVVSAWVNIDRAYFDPRTRGDLKSRIGAARKSWGDFQTLWNAAQRDPAKLRAQLKTADDLLALIQASQSATAKLHFPPDMVKPKHHVGKAVMYTAAGAALVAVGGIIAVVTR